MSPNFKLRVMPCLPRLSQRTPRDLCKNFFWGKSQPLLHLENETHFRSAAVVCTVLLVENDFLYLVSFRTWPCERIPGEEIRFSLLKRSVLEIAICPVSPYPLNLGGANFTP